MFTKLVKYRRGIVHLGSEVSDARAVKVPELIWETWGGYTGGWLFCISLLTPADRTPIISLYPLGDRS